MYVEKKKLSCNPICYIDIPSWDCIYVCTCLYVYTQSLSLSLFVLSLKFNVR